mgnify:CR=1 FL=1
MPKAAIADTLRGWESLLAAAAETAIPGVEKNLAQLQAALERTRALDALRLRLQAERHPSRRSRSKGAWTPGTELW